MEQEKKRSPYQMLWEWARAYHGSFYATVIFAVLGVVCSMIPYFCAAGIIKLLLEGCEEIEKLLPYFGGMLGGYAGKVIFSCISTGISHRATYATLQDLRKQLIAKLSRVPMGTILETPSGQYKTTIVDRVEGMEPGTSLAGDDSKCIGAACHCGLYLCTGLAYGPGIFSHSGNWHGCRGTEWKNLCSTLGRSGKDRETNGRRNCRVCRRYSGSEGVQPVSRFLSQICGCSE